MVRSNGTIKSLNRQCRREDNVATLRKSSVLVDKQDLLWMVATSFATRDIILSATLAAHALDSPVMRASGVARVNH